MKIQGAIENLKYLISDNCTDNQTDFIEEIEIAIDALQKQIPKKPIRTFQSGFFWCADCERAIKMRINHSKINIRYCPFCGRALDWGDEERANG